MDFTGCVHGTKMYSSQMVTVLESGLRYWVWHLAWVIAFCHFVFVKTAFSQYISPGVSMQAGKFNTCTDSEMD